MVGLLALGMAFVTPNLLTLISKRANQATGAALGAQSAAGSLGQSAGPLLGGLLFAWYLRAPYLLAGALLLVIGGVTGWSARAKRSHTNGEDVVVETASPVGSEVGEEE